MTNGADLQSESPARLWRNDGPGIWPEHGADLGIDDRGLGRGSVAFDFDRDGDEDVLFANSITGPELYRNQGVETANWIQVAPVDQETGLATIGTTVSVVTSKGRQRRDIRAGDTYQGQRSAIAHFGLGDSSTVDLLLVTWPDNTTTKIRKPEINQRLTITGPETTG